MENLIFSLNATVPIFLLMILGLLFHKIGWIDDVFAQKMNKFVFVVPLPVLVFSDLATVDFHEVWNMKFVLSCFLATFLSITLVSFMSLGFKERALMEETGKYFRCPTGAVLHFLELHLYRIYMEMQEWHRL